MGQVEKLARPILSITHAQSHRKVLSLYKNCYRRLPYIVQMYDMPKNECQMKWKLREKFYNNASVKDIRIIDLLVFKGYIELNEVVNMWQQKGHLMANWKPTEERKPCTFMEKFFANAD